MNLQGIYLTARQTQVAQLVAYGYMDAEIAKALGVTVRCVEQHMVSILGRLGLRNRYQLQLVVFDRLPLPSTARVRSEAQRKQRNLRIALLRASGMKNVAIAKRFNLPESTVSFIINNLRRKKEKEVAN